MAAACELKIFTPIGMLGYSFSEEIFWSTLADGVDAIIIDSGSTDSGPSKLAFGHTSASHEAYVRDLTLLVKACHRYKVPVLIGSAGGDGTTAHVNLLVSIVTTILSSLSLPPLKILTILAEIPKPLITSKFTSGHITPCGAGVPPLTQSAIDSAVTVVAQMGIEPWLSAMNAHPDFDMIIAGRSYDPAPYAAFCVWKGFTDLGIAYHMGKIMECGASCAVPKSAEALAIVREGSFDIVPCDDGARCTPLSVAAHTMYEKARPDLLAGPGGVLDVSRARFEQLSDGRTLRVSGSRFVEVEKDEYAIKLEAARVTGHMACWVGSIVDPVLIERLDGLVPMVEERLRSVFGFGFEMQVKIFGKDSLVKGLGGERNFPTDVGVLGKVLAETQEQAKAVANLAKVFFIHAPYPGQLATAGNFVMPFSPCDVVLGPASEFCLYHLMQVDDPVELFPFEARVVDGSEGVNGVNGALPVVKVNGTARKINGVGKKEKGLSQIASDITKAASVKTTIKLSPPPKPGHVYLANLANVIRTKNCGPYEITMDVMFHDFETYKKVLDANVLTRETIGYLYDVEKPEHLICCMWWEPALAFKATIKRKAVSGSFRDSDVHGSGLHVPLMYIQVPE
ncbi:hypothetical protein OQA88_9307 [Cercophora sp. LCS_1]